MKDDIKAMLVIAIVTIPIVVITVFIPRGGLAKVGPWVYTWDAIALFLVPAALIALCVRTSRIRTVILSSVLGLVLCGTWSVVTYPVGRIFLMARVVGTGSTFMDLVPLYEAEIVRLIAGCCFLAASALSGAILAILIKRSKEKRQDSPCLSPAAMVQGGNE
jgi:hypothetical protein